ncbi:MAG: SDR family NAD(P)-dependent oxidoreductase [Gammaproteobacteria bacterium]|nr:SDR family NAD(P)-dependent oxidoreductase [Gammaproteobacteria bacterium]
MGAPPAGSMTGKVCLVTGATAGIGLETARALVQAGAEVLLHGRDAARVRAQAQALGGPGGAALQALTADFADLAAARRLGQELAARLPRLDVLVHNAGVFPPRGARSAQGYELAFAVNHLAPFVLTQALLPALTRAAAARIVVVASRAHRRARRGLGALPAGGDCGAYAAYARSKLCNLLFMRALARRLAGSAVTANALHPGVVRTGLFRWLPALRLAVALGGRGFLLNAVQGAHCSVHLATAAELSGISGAYFEACRRVAPSAAARNDADAERLWALSELLSAAR